MKMSLGKKMAIKKMIRTAIKFQNNRTLFSCNDCCFCGDIVCEFEFEDHQLPKCFMLNSLRQPHQLPECFLINPLGTAFADSLDLMLKIGVDSFKSRNGWGTAVSRLISRSDKYGYIINVKRRNLDKYG